MVSIICNTGEWTCSAIGYEALISGTSVAKSTVCINSSRETKAIKLIANKVRAKSITRHSALNHSKDIPEMSKHCGPMALHRDMPLNEIPP